MRWWWILHLLCYVVFCEKQSSDISSDRDTSQAAQVTASLSDHCPPDSTGNGKWHYHDETDKCFFISRTSASWDNAQVACNSIGTSLASVTETQHGFLATVLPSYDDDKYGWYWIGLRLADPNMKTFSWVDGNPDGYRNWAEREPNVYGVEGCGVIDRAEKKWRDNNCQRHYRYICLMGVLVVRPFPLPVVQSEWGCPNCPECFMFRDYCYYVSPPHELKSWFDAERACRDRYFVRGRGYHLVSIHDQLEQDFLTWHLTQDSVERWSGLYQDRPYDRTFFWSDQTPVGDYSNWAPKAPDNNNTGVDCGKLGYKSLLGAWDDNYCIWHRGYICKARREPGAPHPNTTTPSERCAPGYVQVRNACFMVKIVNGDRNAAQRICSSDSQDRLASVLDAFEDIHIRALLEKEERLGPQTGIATAWIGLTYENGMLQYKESKCYATLNNIQDFYQPFVEIKQCVTVETNGRWKTNDCSAVSKYAVCERRMVPCDTVPSRFTGHCPPGFPAQCANYCLALLYNHALAVNQAAVKSYYQAKSDCENRSGRLVCIRSAEDQQCLVRYLTDAFEGLWIGLKEEEDSVTKNYTWKWIDGSINSSFQNWLPGKPEFRNETTGWFRETRTLILPNGMWSNISPLTDHLTSNAFGYICEAAKTIPPPTMSSTVVTPTVTFSTNASYPTASQPTVTTQKSSVSTAETTASTTPSPDLTASTVSMTPPSEETALTNTSVRPVDEPTPSYTSLVVFLPVAAMCLCTLLILTVVKWLKWKRHKLSKGNMSMPQRKFSLLGRSSLHESPVELYYYTHPEAQDLFDFFAIPAENIQLDTPIGKGQFGAVWKATAIGIHNAPSPLTVAVKTSRNNEDSSQRESISKELQILAKTGRHLNIINLLATVKSDVPMLILEYCRFGSLLHYLRSHREKFLYCHVDPDGALLNFDQDHCTQIYNAAVCSATIMPSEGERTADFDVSVMSTKDLIHFAFQITRGMEYLCERRVIHRDLAARNVLVTDSKIVKIADFGLARAQEEYIATNRELPLPVKWMAPESMKKDIFSKKSDVWSFGVLMWELFSYGDMPYSNVHAYTFRIVDLVTWLEEGNRMTRTMGCPLEIFAIVERCWRYEPEGRPGFDELRQMLTKYIDETRSSDYLSLEEPYQRYNEECPALLQ